MSLTCLSTGKIYATFIWYPQVFPTQFFRRQIFRHTFSDGKFSDNHIFRQLHFPTVKFSDGQIFRQTHFPKSLCILLSLIHVTDYTYCVSISFSNNMLIKKLFLDAYNLFMQVINLRSIRHIGLFLVNDMQTLPSPSPPIPPRLIFALSK